MAADENDLVKKVGIGTATTLSSPGKAMGATSVTVGSTANFPTTTGIVFAIRQVDSNGELVAGTYTEWSGTVTSGTTLAMNATPVYGTDQVYTAGSTTQVYMPLSSYGYNKAMDAILAEHEQLDGTHKAALITSRTEDTDPDPDADFVLSYDTSATALKKVKLNKLGASDGWVSNVLAAPNTITNNGNRSYDLVFNSTDLTDTLSEGMRLRTTRTVSAPTQCADLEASSSQYFSKSSPTGMTFTDDFVVSAWVKLESYARGVIASRWNGTSGWVVEILADGRVQTVGYNASASNYSLSQSYQSVPLNKWVHIASQLDMSAFTATTTTSYVMIDGVNVPAAVVRAGTNPTALVQAGNLEIGSNNGGLLPFDGKLAQVAVFGAKVTQATMQGYYSQGLSGSETNLVCAYSLANDITDLSANNNDLTANGGALATNVDSPFGNYLGGTLDYAIITKKAFSTNTTLTVQVPEGCTIPTSGGVSAVAYSTQKAPYGMPVSRGRWRVQAIQMTQQNSGSVATGTVTNVGSYQLNTPVGDGIIGYEIPCQQNPASGNNVVFSVNLSTSSSAFTNVELTGFVNNACTAVMLAFGYTVGRTTDISNTAATPYYFLMRNDLSVNGIQYVVSGTNTSAKIYWEPANL